MTKSSLIRRSESLRAMTMPELMIALSICSVIAIASMTAYVASMRGIAKSYQFNKSAQEARLIGDTIAKDIRSASGREAVYFDGTTTHSGDSTLILQAPRINADGQLVDTENPQIDYIVYEPDPENSKILYRRVFPTAGSSRASESRCYGDAYGPTSYFWAFDSSPGADPQEVGFKFMIERTVKGATYRTPISGSVRMRNRSMATP